MIIKLKIPIFIFVTIVLLATKCITEEDYLLVNNQTHDTLYVIPSLILEDTLRPFKYRLRDYRYVIYPFTKKRMFDFPLMALKEEKYWNEIVQSDTARIFIFNKHFRNNFNNTNYDKYFIKEYKLVIEDIQNKEFVLIINFDKED